MSEFLNLEERVKRLEQANAEWQELQKLVPTLLNANTLARQSTTITLKELADQNMEILKLISSNPAFLDENGIRKLLKLLTLRENRIDQITAAHAAITAKLPPPPPDNPPPA